MDRHELEQLRRSVVMLTPGQAITGWTREQLLGVLDDLATLKRDRDNLAAQLRRALGET